jgi:hypothetical protein
MSCVLLTTASTKAAAPATLTAAEVDALNSKAKTMVETLNVVQGIAIYEQIYESTKDPKYLYNIGYLYEDTGQFDMAWDFYQRFLLAWPGAPNAKKLQSYMGELKGKLETDYVLVHVFTTPPGARITVVTSENERKPSGVTPMSTWMPFGDVTLRVTLEGQQTLNKQINVKPRKSQRLRMNLTPIAKATDLSVGAVGPGTTLAIDGKYQGKLSAGQRIPLSPGVHTLTLTLSDGTQRTHSLIVKDDTVSPAPPAEFWTSPETEPSSEGTVSDVSADLSASSSASSGVGQIPLGVWITGSVAVASASIAATFMALAHGSAEEARRYMGDVQTEVDANNLSGADAAHSQWEDADATATTQQTLSIALFSAAGAAAAASLIWWLVDTPASEVNSNEARLTPIILHDGLGAQATWSF